MLYVKNNGRQMKKLFTELGSISKSSTKNFSSEFVIACETYKLYKLDHGVCIFKFYMQFQQINVFHAYISTYIALYFHYSLF